MVSDEVICAYGRLGHMFACERYGYLPDVITSAKALTSAYQPIGAMIVRDRLGEAFVGGGQNFMHGITFGGHPVATAVALRNLQIFEDEQLLQRVLKYEVEFKQALESLLDLPIIGDLRGEGYFYALELVKDRDTAARFDDAAERQAMLASLRGRLAELGIICRADDRADPLVQLAPPLISGPEHFDEIVSKLRTALTEAMARNG
jgi:adenosylmethionine-8-amino-7-oxononanoate aminotransferase